MNCTPKVRQKKSNFWGIFIMKLTYEDKVQIYELRKQGKNRYYSPKLKQEMIDKILLEGCSQQSVCLDYGLSNQGLLNNWIAQYKNGYTIVEKTRGRPPKMGRKRKYSSYQGEVGKKADDLIQRQFEASKLMEKCYTDVTEFAIPASSQKLYLSPVLDGFNSEIVAYNLSRSPNLVQVKAMIEQAFTEDHYENTILYSDQGWQYQHDFYHHFLEDKGIQPSMSRKGNSPDNGMIDAFLSGYDIHAATAAKIYKVDINDVTADMRRKAKTANFGIIYGISVFGLAERMNVPRQEAKELIDGYFETYPQVKEYMDRSIQVARENGYVETIFHRKRFLPDINSRNAVVRGYAERNAINAPIQGSAADIIKVAMSLIYQRFQSNNLKAKMILQVHDELNFSVPEAEKEIIQKIVIEEMERAYRMLVPLKADCGWGKNWLEAH